MERLDVFNCSDIFIASFFTDDRECLHENREHTLLYLCSGELEIEERGKKTLVHPGDCAFMRRDNWLWLQKKAAEGKPYRSVVLKFSRAFLRDFYQRLDRHKIPFDSKREKVSLRLLPNNRPDIRSLFESIIPYFDAAQSMDVTEQHNLKKEKYRKFALMSASKISLIFQNCIKRRMVWLHHAKLESDAKMSLTAKNTSSKVFTFA